MCVWTRYTGEPKPSSVVDDLSPANTGAMARAAPHFSRLFPRADAFINLTFLDQREIAA